MTLASPATRPPHCVYEFPLPTTRLCDSVLWLAPQVPPTVFMQSPWKGILPSEQKNGAFTRAISLYPTIGLPVPLTVELAPLPFTTCTFTPLNRAVTPSDCRPSLPFKVSTELFSTAFNPVCNVITVELSWELLACGKATVPCSLALLVWSVALLACSAATVVCKACTSCLSALMSSANALDPSISTTKDNDSAILFIGILLLFEINGLGMKQNLSIRSKPLPSVTRSGGGNRAPLLSSGRIVGKPEVTVICLKATSLSMLKHPES